VPCELSAVSADAGKRAVSPIVANAKIAVT